MSVLQPIQLFDSKTQVNLSNEARSKMERSAICSLRTSRIKKTRKRRTTQTGHDVGVPLMASFKKIPEASILYPA